MNGLTTGEEHLKLIAVIFQNIVPPINVNTVSFSVIMLSSHWALSTCAAFIVVISLAEVYFETLQLV